MHPDVIRAVSRALKKYPGNPSASHTEGREAHDAIQEARKCIAETFAVKPEELVFTSGGTESNNIAIRGVVEALRKRGASYREIHIITTAIEHSSVLETVASLEAEGVFVTRVTPESDGIVDVKKILAAIRENTALLTLAHVNSEIGTIQPLAEIGTGIAKRRKEMKNALSKYAPEAPFPILHADCAQSPLYLEAGPHVIKADLVSYDAQKVQGPKGVGVLYRDFSVPLVSIYGGGTQERNIRPGTENAAGIVGAGVAFQTAKKNRAARAAAVQKLRDRLIEGVQRAVPEAELMGSRKKRIANNAHFSIPGSDGDYLAVVMDSLGVAVSPRSACIGSGGNLSHVIFSLTGDASRAKGTVRFSLGPSMSVRDIDRIVSALAKSLGILRRAPPQ
jgi:cysteine desulfurase